MTKLMKMVLSAWPVLRSICVGGCLVLGAGVATAAELPAGYTQVEYIESTKGGGQYIDTGYTANATTKVVMDAYLPPKEEQYDDSVVLFGARSTPDESKGIDWSTKAFSIQLLGLNCIRFAYNGGYFDSPVVSFGGRRTITCDNKHVEWTGSNAGSKAVTVSPLAQSKSTLYIFGDNTVTEDGDKRNGAFNRSVMRLYSFRIYEGDVFKRDFVPCVKTATGEAGLYDRVEGRFYANKGDEAFVAGRAVESVECYDLIGETNITVTAAVVTKDTATFDDGGWYVVKENVECDMITVRGTANLILADGAKLTVNGVYEHAGIVVADGNSLTIWGQANGTGEVTVNGGYWGAGVGSDYKNGDCGMVTINGGVVTATGGRYGAGIGGGYHTAGGTVTINGGKVTANGGDDGGAGIGGGNGGGTCGAVTINGGVVTATGGSDGAGIGGDGGAVSINGGMVTATGGSNGAGIGGGWFKKGCTVEITGGVVTATGVNGGAGIGSGRVGSSSVPIVGGTVTITGGTVTATGSNGGAGIGGGDGESSIGSTVTINGGSVNASSIQDVRGCPTNGKGAKVYCVTVPCEATSCVVTGLEGYGTSVVVPIGGKLYLYLPNKDGEYVFFANGVKYMATVGNAPTTAEARMTVNFTLGEHVQEVDFATNPTITNGVVTTDFTLSDLPWGTVITLDATCDAGYVCIAEKTLTVGYENLNIALTAEPILFASVDYCDSKGNVHTTNDVLTLYPNMDVEIGSGKWYVVGVATEIGALTVVGEANVILRDGAKLTVNGGIRVEGVNALNIYGQINGTGELVARGDADCAGIGGGDHGAGGTVTINGGTVTAVGGAGVGGGSGGGAGIGGGYKGNGGKVTINGGTVTATGGYWAAGIGGGNGGSGGTVTIDGGVVTATGATNAAGIGGSNGGSGGTVTINGGVVTATGGTDAAGIGGGSGGAGGGIVTINGGTVTATGGKYGAGIGGGYHGSGDTVMINGGTVTATGGVSAAGIGGGSHGAGGSVAINGGAVTATGVEDGAGIGGGEFGAGGTVTINGGTVTATGGAFEVTEGTSTICVGGAGIGGGWFGAGGTVTITGGMVTATGGYWAAGIGGGVDSSSDGEVSWDSKRVKIDDGDVGSGHSYVKFVEIWVGPTCEGGEIAEGADGVWFVTPTVDVTEVTVAGLPEDAFVAVPPTITRVNGVNDAQVKVRSGAYDITGAFTVSGGAIALDENGVVTIGGEEIPVKPTIGDLDEGEPFMVDKGVVMVAVKAIPGLRYALVRGESVEGCRRDGGITEEGGGTVIESVVATGGRVALSDSNPPEDGAFYVISVSCPVAVGPSDSTIRIVGGRVYSGQYDITDAVTICGDGTVELKAGGVVGGVKVTPVIGDLPPSSDSVDDAASQLFLGGKDGVALTFETIPGLCYGLLRGETPDKVDALVGWHWAESETMTLKDFTPPKDGAFYRIVVNIDEF